MIMWMKFVLVFYSSLVIVIISAEDKKLMTYSEAVEEWRSYHCVFPDPSTYTPNITMEDIVMGNGNPLTELEPCSLIERNKLAFQNATLKLDLCQHLYKESINLCKSGQEVVKLLTPEKLKAVDFGGDVCSFVNKSLPYQSHNMNIPSLQNATTCKQVCLTAKSAGADIKPVCELLASSYFIVMKNEKGHTQEDHKPTHPPPTPVVSTKNPNPQTEISNVNSVASNVGGRNSTPAPFVEKQPTGNDTTKSTPASPDGKQSQGNDTLKSTPASPDGKQSQGNDTLKSTPASPDGKQSQGNDTLKSTPASPDGKQSQGNDTLKSTPASPDRKQLPGNHTPKSTPASPDRKPPPGNDTPESTPASPDGRQPPEANNQQPTVLQSNVDDPSASSHFLPYFLTAVVICIAGYVIFHNRQKILAVLLEGRNGNGRGGRRSKDVKYSQLKSNVEEVMPTLEKTAAAKNFVY